MAFRPDDLETKVFGTARRGYDPVQVRTYLGSIATSMRNADRDREQARVAGDLAQADAKEILEAARETAKSIRAEAHRDADDIRSAARAETLQPVAVVSAHDLDGGGEGSAKTERLLELRAETERLRLEAVAALESAAEERQQAEEIRADSHREIQRLRQQVDALRSSAEQQIRAVQPGAMLSLGSAMPAEEDDDSSPSGKNILVVDTNTGDANPLASAVKSAVGGAFDPKT